MPQCRPETASFASTAPVRTTAVRELPAPPARVFEALADPASWTTWFPGLRSAAWTSSAPYGVGSTRSVEFGAQRIDERFIVWDPGERFGFTFTGTRLPMARAGVEVAELVALPDGRTRLAYTIAIEPPFGLPPALVRPLLPGIRAALGRGLAGLDRHLSTA